MNWQQKVWKGTMIIIQSCKQLILYIFMPGLVSTIGKILRQYKKTDSEFVQESGNFYIFLGTLVVGYILYKKAKKRGTTLCEETTLSFDNIDYRMLINCVLAGFATSLLISSCLTLIKIPLLSENYHQASARIYNRTDVFLVMIMIGMLSPILEEIIFRGYMINKLLTFFSEKHTVIISAFIFSICHVDIIWIIYSFVMGIVLGQLAIRKDNIVYSISVHIGFNFPSVLFVLINMSDTLEKVLFSNVILIVVYGVISFMCMRKLWTDIKAEVW